MSIQLNDEKKTAAMLGLSRVTLHRLRKAGELGFHRIGSRVMYSDEHLRSFLEGTENVAGRRRRSDA